MMDRMACLNKEVKWRKRKKRKLDGVGFLDKQASKQDTRRIYHRHYTGFQRTRHAKTTSADGQETVISSKTSRGLVTTVQLQS